MIKLTDYICNYLSKVGVTDVFMISGGGAMHLVDSVGKHPKLDYYCPHHEQAAAIAAEGYSRVSGKMGAVVVTSGPGGTNTLTGVIGQWLDSIPCLYLSGQVKFETTIASCPELKLRQLGDQEINIVDLVKPVTKYAVMVTDPKTIRYHLERAIYLATHGRPGPVWLDIPLNVQAAMIDEKILKPYDSKQDQLNIVGARAAGQLQKQVRQVIEKLRQAKRPVIIAGHGIRLAQAQNEFLALAKALGVPVLSTFNGFDLIASDNSLFIGRIGTLGSRAGNFALQNADLVLSIGSRNNIRQVSYQWETYARHAYKIFVDIDPKELKKPTVKPSLGIAADAGEFIIELAKQFQRSTIGVNEKQLWGEWLDWCQVRKERYPVVLPKYRISKAINPYNFVDLLTAQANEKTIAVAGNGTACVALFQAGNVKAGQRMFWNSGCASMGYDLPASIGAAVAGRAQGNREVICLAGDGSLQMNLQELQTMAFHKLPIKLFVLNNSGYISIRQTQDNFFAGRYCGCDESCGVSTPDVVKVAKAFGLPAVRIEGSKNLNSKIKKVLAMKGPVVIEVVLAKDYIFAPKLSSEKKSDGRMVSKPLEDLYPFLSREELCDNMLVPLWPEE